MPPADLVPVHDRVDGEHERDRDQHRAGHVQAPVGREALRRRQQAERECDNGHTDRHVDEEDPVPVEQVGEDAAQDDADRAASGRDEPDHAHRLGAVGRLGEERHGQRERDGGDDRAAEPLNRASADEEPLRRREPARERRGGEERDPDDEELAVPVEVAEPPAEEQEAPEREQVGVDDPRERALGESEVLADRRQRDVHDRRVEDDHQVSRAEDEEGKPARAAVEGHSESFLTLGKRAMVREPSYSAPSLISTISASDRPWRPTGSPSSRRRHEAEAHVPAAQVFGGSSDLVRRDRVADAEPRAVAVGRELPEDDRLGAPVERVLENVRRLDAEDRVLGDERLVGRAGRDLVGDLGQPADDVAAAFAEVDRRPRPSRTTTRRSARDS